jgi:SnoaL-like domain
MSQRTETRNKAIVLEAFDTLFNKRDYVAAARFWSPNYVQHSAHIEPGRDGLFNLIKNMPPTFKHEHEQVVSDGELVIVHSRFSGFGQAKNCEPFLARDLLIGRNSAGPRRNPQHAEEVRRDARVVNEPRFIATGQCVRVALVLRHNLKRAGLRSPRLILTIGGASSFRPLGRRGVYQREALRPGVRQRTEEHRVKHTEDRRICADPDCDREHNGFISTAQLVRKATAGATGAIGGSGSNSRTLGHQPHQHGFLVDSRPLLR